MKLSDLLVDYAEVDGLRIVRLLHLDVFLAIRNSGRVVDRPVVYHLGDDELERLKRNELTAKELYEDEFSWHDIGLLESLYTEADIEEIIEDAKKKGYLEKNEVTREGMDR